MKKILGLTIAALLVMGLVGTGTWAYFSDTETSTNNVLSAGTLDLTLAGGTADGTAIDSVTATWTSPAEWAPGSTAETGTLTLDNVGTVDMTVIDLTVTAVETAGTPMSGYSQASSEPEYVAEGGSYVAGVVQDDNTPDSTIGTVIDIVTLTYNSVDLIADGGVTFDIAAIEAADTDDDLIIQLDELIAATSGGLDLIATASTTALAGDGAGVTTHVLAIDFQLNGDNTGNVYQGDQATVSLSIIAQQ
ncbi:TasA family protein [Chloroflexota bacterium]